MSDSVKKQIIRLVDHLNGRDVRALKFYERTTIEEAIKAGIGRVEKNIFIVQNLIEEEDTERAQGPSES